MFDAGVTGGGTAAGSAVAAGVGVVVGSAVAAGAGVAAVVVALAAPMPSRGGCCAKPAAADRRVAVATSDA